jgi:hypothetical protein
MLTTLVWSQYFAAVVAYLGVAIKFRHVIACLSVSSI